MPALRMAVLDADVLSFDPPEVAETKPGMPGTKTHNRKARTPRAFRSGGVLTAPARVPRGAKRARRLQAQCAIPDDVWSCDPLIGAPTRAALRPIAPRGAYLQVGGPSSSRHMTSSSRVVYRGERRSCLDAHVLSALFLAELAMLRHKANRSLSASSVAIWPFTNVSSPITSIRMAPCRLCQPQRRTPLLPSGSDGSSCSPSASTTSG